MNIFRAVPLFCVLGWSQIARAMPAPSGRKIAPVEVGDVVSSRTTMSRDGRFLSLLSLPGEKGSDCIVIDRRTHRTTLLPGSSRMEPLCFSRDGRRLWVWGLHLDEALPGLRLKPRNRPFIALYDLRRKRYIRALSGVRDDWEVPGDAALSRDGKTLITVAEGGSMCGFNTRTGRMVWSRAQKESDESVSVALSGDGSKFLRTSDDENGEAQSAEVVATRSGRVISRVRLPISRPGAMRSAFSGGKFAPRGAQVAVFQADTQQWVFFNSRTGRVQWKMGGPSPSSEGNLSWQWSPDARLVGVSGPRGLEVRNARNGRIVQKCAVLAGDALTFSPDGSRVYALTGNDSGFGNGTALWQWRLFPTRSQTRVDARFMRRLRASEARFALSPRHINDSLILAARRGDAARVALLLDHGANIETLDGRGDTPLVNAVSGSGAGGPGHFYQTAKLLIARGASVQKRGGELLASATTQSELLLKLLLAQGARVNDDASRYGTATALHAAASSAQLGSARILLQHGANPNARDAEGVTPLMELANRFDLGSPLPKEVVPLARLLIERGADVNARNKSGQTAMEMTPDETLKAVLRKAGAEP